MSAASPLSSGLKRTEAPTLIMLGHRKLADEAEDNVTYFGMLQKMSNDYSIVKHHYSNERRDAFIAKSVEQFRSDGLTLGPDSRRTGYRIGNLSGTNQNKTDAIISAFGTVGVNIQPRDIIHKKPTADETWMFTFDAEEAAAIGLRDIFCIHVEEPVKLHGFSAAKEALIAISNLLIKKQSGKTIFMNFTDLPGKTIHGYDRALHDSLYGFMKILEARKRDGRDVATHGSDAKHRLYLGVADVVLRSAKALTKYHGDYDPIKDAEHVEYCVRAAQNMMDTCKQIEDNVKAAKKLTFGDEAPLRLYTAGYAANIGLKEAFVHLVL